MAGYFFANGVIFSSWVSRIPDVKAGAGLNEAQLGLALLAMGVGTFLALPPVSWLLARFGSKPVSIISALGCCLLLPLAGRAPTLPWLIPVLLPFGAVLGAMDVGMNAQASTLEKQAGRSIMSSFHGVWSLGALTGASLGGVFASRGHMPAAHFLVMAAAMSIVVLLAGMALLRDPHLSTSPAGADAPPPRLAWPSRPVLAIGFVAACGAIVEGGLADWSALYLRESLGQTAAFATSGYAAFSLAMMVGRFGGDRLIDGVGGLALLRGGGLLAGLAIAGALLVPHPLVVVGALAVAGLGMCAVFPIAFSAAGVLPSVLPGPAIAAVATMAYGAGLLGPPLIGFAAGATSLRAALGLLVLGCGVIALVAGRLNLRPPRHASHIV